MGPDTPETYRGSRNILSISCATSWFFFTQIYGYQFVNSTTQPTKSMWNFETFSLPTDAHNVKKHRVIKTF